MPKHEADSNPDQKPEARHPIDRDNPIPAVLPMVIEQAGRIKPGNAEHIVEGAAMLARVVSLGPKE
ncbi:hypothetical protein KY385_00200 [Candidatus Parcubacteria bacterium]|nr:hypothetical protein [Candidatus Parcubacteria bacterium]